MNPFKPDDQKASARAVDSSSERAIQGGATTTYANGAAFRRPGAERHVSMTAQGVKAQALARSPHIRHRDEHDYWRANYRNRDYVPNDAAYESFAPAYQFGWESYCRLCLDAGGRVRGFDEVESQLAKEWRGGDHDLAWTSARRAARDAWERAQRIADPSCV